MKRQKYATKIVSKKNNKISIAVLLGAAILFYACENDIETIKAFSSPKDLPVLTAEDFETTSIDSGNIQFYLKTPLLQQFETDGQSFIEFPKGLLLVKYDNNGNIISSIKADYAKQLEREKKWEAKNNVVAVNAKGDTLKTEFLVWEENEKIIHSDKFVKIITEDRIITGIGFNSNENLENWRIMNIKGSFYVNVNQSDTGEVTEPPTNEMEKEQNIRNDVQKPVNIKN